MTPPIRFLAATVGSWACVRGAMLVPWPAQPPGHIDGPVAAPDPGTFTPAPKNVGFGATKERLPSPKPDIARVKPPAPGNIGKLRPYRAMPMRAVASPYRSMAFLPEQPHAISGGAVHTLPAFVAVHRGVLPDTSSELRPALGNAQPASARWTVSAWVYTRRGEAAALVPGGTLGGSQAGARVRYRLSSPLSLTARISAPLRRSAGAEAALGAEWQPLAAVPVRILAERRQAIGSEGRNAFALTLHGGVSALPLPAGFRLDAYGQAGVVGARSRNLFADGALRAARPVLGQLSIGAGVWGAAQPGTRRLDVGPSVSLRVPAAGATISADWRFRAAGNARPGSGPALTLWTDF